MEALAAAVRATPTIRLLEGYEAEGLLTEGGRVHGVRAMRLADRRRLTLPAAAVVLASGGIESLRRHHQSAASAQHEGRRGRRRTHRQLVVQQFHPTAIAIGRDPAPLASEAIRGEARP